MHEPTKRPHLDQTACQFHGVHDLHIVEQITLTSVLSGILDDARYQMDGTAALLQHVQQTDRVTIGMLLVSECVEKDQPQSIVDIHLGVADKFLDALWTR